eukprot:Nk52_evm1s2502 gene=Nk52_evmTU1s2502
MVYCDTDYEQRLQTLLGGQTQAKGDQEEVDPCGISNLLNPKTMVGFLRVVQGFVVRFGVLWRDIGAGMVGNVLYLMGAGGVYEKLAAGISGGAAWVGGKKNTKKNGERAGGLE